MHRSTSPPTWVLFAFAAPLSRFTLRIGGTFYVSLLAFMDKSEAHKILGEQLARFGSYAELMPLVESGSGASFEICGASGAKYQVEIQFFWDDKRGQVIRIIGSIDDGGTRVFVPLTDSLLISPPNSLLT